VTRSDVRCTTNDTANRCKGPVTTYGYINNDIAAFASSSVCRLKEHRHRVTALTVVAVVLTAQQKMLPLPRRTRPHPSGGPVGSGNSTPSLRTTGPRRGPARWRSPWTASAPVSCCPAAPGVMPRGSLEFGFYMHNLDESENDHHSLLAASAWWPPAPPSPAPAPPTPALGLPAGAARQAPAAAGLLELSGVPPEGVAGRLWAAAQVGAETMLTSSLSSACGWGLAAQAHGVRGAGPHAS
jgi:hypothetical protein